MSEGALAMGRADEARPVKHRTYTQAALGKLFGDPVTVGAMALLAFMVSITVAAPWIADSVLGFSPTRTSLRNRNAPPTWMETSWPVFQEFTASCGTGDCRWELWGEIGRETRAGLGACLAAALGECHWMGTDQAGRDVLTRALYGGRVSLRIGIYVAGVTMTLGVLMGLIAGYYAATFIDDIINAVILLLGSIPLLFLLIILARIFSPSPEGLALLLGLFGWMGTARLLRGQIFSVRERDFIQATRAVGSSEWRVMFRHILPNVASIVIVVAVFDVAGAIISEAGLSYLGVGIQPPTASWGNMMQGSLGNFTAAPWLVLTPGLFIFLTTLSIYLVGDGLRDALDPWVKRVKKL